MKRQGIIVTGLFLAICIVSLIAAPHLQAEESQAVAKDTDAKLAELSDEEIDAIDEKLSRALVLYYDREFNQALPMFLDIAGRIETVDVMFWIGTSALEAGNLPLAVEKFKKALAVDPSLKRERIKLAQAYIELGMIEEAKAELRIVETEDPTEGEKEEIATLRARIGEASKRTTWSMRVSTGFLFDSNANSGPEHEAHVVPGGTITPDKKYCEQEDVASVTRIRGSVLYDIGSKNGWIWYSGGNVYNKTYFHETDYNYFKLNISTGPWYAGSNFLIKLPVGYSDRWLENDHLSNSIHFDPSYRYYFTRNVDLTARYSYSYTNYYGRSAIDNHTHRFDLTPAFSINNRMNNFAITAGYAYKDAEKDRFSYDGPYYAFSYMARPFPRTTLLFRFDWSDRDYDGRDTLYLKKRGDQRSVFTIGLRQGFLDNFTLSLEYALTDNNSNMDLYTYKRSTFTSTVEYAF
jgi:tetratricopeptide (TPR) repeat protein